jgi:hypothetical protein
MPIHFSDPGSSAPPRLALGHSHWALGGLAEPADHYIKQLKSNGFESLEVGMAADRLETAKKAKAEGLKIIAQGWAQTFDAAKQYTDTAAQLGGVWGLNLHLGHAFMDANEAANLSYRAREYANSVGLLMVTEVHRACITQDLFRMPEWIAQDSGVRFCLDISHVIVAGSGHGGPKELFFKFLQPVLERTTMIHGRIGDTQCVQSDIGDGKAWHVDIFLEIWTAAMKAWRRNAKPGDVLVFEPELGPPGYAQTDLSGKQLSDRWKQSLVVAEVGKRAWAASAN